MSDLLAEIRAAPHDRSLRAVYADDLLARGDPRGELIALELQDRRVDVAARRRALRRQHARSWWGLPSHQVWTHGGFATCIELRAGDRVPDLARELVTELVVDGEVPDDVIAAAVRDTPAVTLRGQRSATWATTLCSARPSLDTLTLIGCEQLLPWAAGTSLVGRLPAVRELRILDGEVGPPLVSGLLAWPHLAQIERLVVDRFTRPSAPLAVLLRNLSGLRALQWIRPELRADAEGTEVIRAIDTHSRLRQVDLMEPRLSGVMLPRRLAPMPRATRVELALPDHDLELVEEATDQWRVIVDGEARALRWQMTSTYEEGGRLPFYANELQIADHVEDTAPLAAIALGIELQRPPRVDGNQVEVWARGSFRYTGAAADVEAATDDGFRYRRFGPRAQFRIDQAMLQIPESGPVGLHLHEAEVGLDDD